MAVEAGHHWTGIEEIAEHAHIIVMENLESVCHSTVLLLEHLDPVVWGEADGQSIKPQTHIPKPPLQSLVYNSL
jgi:hypothetical protein